MSFERFCASVRAHRQSGRARGVLAPVWRDCLLDTDTPVSAFAKLRRDDAGGPFAFLLESAPAGGETWARFTYLGTSARAAWRLRDGVVEEWTPCQGWHGERRPADPLADLHGRMVEWEPVPAPELDAHGAVLWGGAVGYFGYDAVRYIEQLPTPPPQGVDAPDALFVFTRSLVIVDNLRGEARIVVAVPVAADPTPHDEALRTLYDEAQRDIDGIVARLQAPSPLRPLALDPAAAPATGRSVTPRARFLRDVQRIREYILAGDCFQALLARRIVVPLDFDPTSLYRALRVLNPSPYMYHLVFDGLELVGSSPELLVRVQDGRVTLRPIAGTRPRGETADDDAERAAELLADAKERAEHSMLVDLGRNDVGRIAQYGTVRVTELMVVERYSHVLHIVSQVEGILRGECSALDVFRATFPAGTMTGAPKVRAMQIIDALEGERRGPYAGAVGWIGAGGKRMDLAITIRTCVMVDGEASVQTGAGIVADSVPEREWDETESKARALLTAIGRVRAASPSAPHRAAG